MQCGVLLCAQAICGIYDTIGVQKNDDDLGVTREVFLSKVDITVMVVCMDS
jgi:hypothetical protein